VVVTGSSCGKKNLFGEEKGQTDSQYLTRWTVKGGNRQRTRWDAGTRLERIAFSGIGRGRQRSKSAEGSEKREKIFWGGGVGKERKVAGEMTFTPIRKSQTEGS